MTRPGARPLQPPLEAREGLVNAQASVPVDLSGIEESEKTITADGYTINLNVVRPEGVNGKLPVFMFIHGGGWVLGDYPTHKRMVRDLVVLTAESDILRDEGEAYGRKLDEADVKATTVRYDGMIHDFGLLNGLADEPAVRSLFEHAAAELKKYLQ